MGMNLNFFQNRKLLIATKHHKELVMGSIFEKELGVHPMVNRELDTDLFGTFSGEIKRGDDPITTLRKKCEWAMEETGIDLAVASEGSFGPHPQAFFIPADDEFVMLIDKKNKLEIIAREISTETNYNGEYVSSEKALCEFAEKIGFPSHAIILKSLSDNPQVIIKGINHEQKLIENFNALMAQFGKVYAETDMRAMYNPTRMNVIQKATYKLIEKIKHVCPSCQLPGFDVDKINEGLLCSNCGSKTKSVLSFVYKCKQCLFEQEKMFPLGKTKEEPMYCNNCNP